ncbi:MAG: PD-(D/E)XK nuclease family protein [Elusimicrobiota bacterium]
MKIISKILYFFFRRLTLSYSQISMYLRCPLQYKLAYKLFIKTDQTPAMSYGSTIHDVLEVYHRLRRKVREGDLEILYRLLDECWVREGFVDSPLEVTEEFKEKGRKLLKQYYEENLGYDAEPLFLEQWFNVTIGGHRLNGVIDRIEFFPDGTYALLDYKTHFDKSTKEPISEDLQMSLYQIACVEDVDLARNVFFERKKRLKRKLKKDVKEGRLPKSEFRSQYKKTMGENK